MEITSPAFEHHHPIPKRHTCQGEDISPQLNFSKIPAKTQTLAIIVEDPDAPGKTYDHWVAWNLSPNLSMLKEGESAPNEGKNHYNQVGYRGPCPPYGNSHRYFFKVYALDTRLDLPNGATKEELEKAMEGHILDTAELIGTYQRT